jgi:hypothetical protein
MTQQTDGHDVKHPSQLTISHHQRVIVTHNPQQGYYQKLLVIMQVCQCSDPVSC